MFHDNSQSREHNFIGLKFYSSPRLIDKDMGLAIDKKVAGDTRSRQIVTENKINVRVFFANLEFSNFLGVYNPIPLEY